ncbi:MAG: hypothetical protein ACOCUP_02935 [bacterium]
MKNSDKIVKEIRVSDLTVYTVEDTKLKADELLQKGNRVKIVFENVSGIDLSYIQLIYAIRNNDKSLELSCEFEGDLPDDIRELITNTGFAQILA